MVAIISVSSFSTCYLLLNHELLKTIYLKDVAEIAYICSVTCVPTLFLILGCVPKDFLTFLTSWSSRFSHILIRLVVAYSAITYHCFITWFNSLLLLIINSRVTNYFKIIILFLIVTWRSLAHLNPWFLFIFRSAS